ncbi:MAG TPA: glycosyltransferase family 39 protein [Candidatus Omnitrophota bacterium]|nr:glycosyltransferase family 39 protein [Candidatus Omnitrophota bacterium]
MTVIFILGLGLRLHKLDYQSFWGDEYINIVLAQGSHVWRECLLHIIPPAYIFLLAGWIKIFALSETTARILGALIGAFSIIPFYFLGKRLFNKNVGILASLFLSLSALHINYCQEVKYYPLVFLMAILVNLAYVNIWHKPTLKHFVYYVLSFTVGLYTHYYFGIFFAIHLLHLFFNRKNTLFHIPKILYAQGAIALLFSPILVYTLLNLKRIAGSTSWISAPTISSIPNTLSVMLYGDEWVSGEVLLVFYSTFFALFFFTYRFSQRQWSTARMPISLTLLWLSVPPLVFYIFSLVVFPVYQTRYLLVSMLGLYLLLAWAVDSIPPPPVQGKIRLKTLVPVLWLIFLMLLSVIFFYAFRGHEIITRMYNGQSLDFLNRTIESQAIYPLKDYLAKGDRIFRTIVNLGFLFGFFIILSNQPSLHPKRTAMITLRTVIIAFFICNNIFSLIFYFHHPVRAQFRETAGFISKHCATNERILVKGYTPEGGLFEYYFKKSGLPNAILTDYRRKTPTLEGYDWIVDVFRDTNHNSNLSLMKEFCQINVYRAKTPPAPH